MMPDEREKLLALFHGSHRWCQGVEARDPQGDPVRYDDADAVAWDITGAMCHLFGWRRACALFQQLDRHISGRKRSGWSGSNPEIASLIALQDYNDQDETTYDLIVTQLRTMPVWQGRTSQ